MSFPFITSRAEYLTVMHTTRTQFSLYVFLLIFALNYNPIRIIFSTNLNLDVSTDRQKRQLSIVNKECFLRFKIVQGFISYFNVSKMFTNKNFTFIADTH